MEPLEEKGRSWRVNRMKWGITQWFTEPYSPWQNHAAADCVGAEEADQALY